MIKTNCVKRFFILISCLSCLQSCSDESDVDVKQFIAQAKLQPSSDIESLPTLYKTNIVHYTSHSLKNPFDPSEISLTRTESGKDRSFNIDPDRPREVLESYPIESLRMVGYLEKEGEFWGLVLDANNNIHRVKEGQYLGTHEGRIEKIDSTGIEIQEWTLSGNNQLQEKRVSLPLIDVQGDTQP